MAAMIFRMEPITAKIPNVDVLWREIVSRMQESAEDVRKSYAEFTDTWEAKPQYTIKLNRKKNVGMVEFVVSPAADESLLQIMHWTIYGTKAHTIEPKYIGFGMDWYPLRFPGTFTPKTQPGVIQSRPGGKDFSGDWITADKVWHPGTHPRGTIAMLYQLHRPRFRARMELAIRDGVKKAKATAK